MGCGLQKRRLWRQAVAAAPLALGLGLAPPAPAQAQADAGFLGGLVQSALSGPGRDVRIEGLEGALSSQARIAQLTLSDEAGVWLRLSGIELDWSRLALLRRRLEVTALTIEQVELLRRPLAAAEAQEATQAAARTTAAAPAMSATSAADGLPDLSSLPALQRLADLPLPRPEAGTGLTLPELPLAVRIGRIEATRVILAQPVLGRAAQLRLAGSGQLERGEGQVELGITRTDGQEGSVDLRAAYANVTGRLRLNLALAEPADGIVAQLLDMPGRPSLALEVSGAGPLGDFRADLSLASDGVQRLEGTLRIATGAEDAATMLQADLRGDPRALMQPKFAGFFGADARLGLRGLRGADGALGLQALEVETAQMTLRAAGDLAPSGLPRRALVTLALADPAGGDVRLPLPGAPVALAGADLRLGYDAAAGDAGWRLQGDLRGLRHPELHLQGLRLAGSGRIDAGGGLRSLGGTLALNAEGLAPKDPALAQALGPAPGIETKVFWSADAPQRLSLRALRLGGGDYGLEASVALDLEAGDLRLDGALGLEARDLSRFGALIGQPALAGAGTVDWQGEVTAVAGGIDGRLEVAARDLALGVPEVDGLLAGDSRLTLDLRRDQDGIVLREGALGARGGLDLTLAGRVASSGSTLRGRVAMADLSVLGAGYGGGLAGEVVLEGTATRNRLTAGLSTTDLALGLPQLRPLTAGKGGLRLVADWGPEGGRLEELGLTLAGLEADLQGTWSPEGAAIAGQAELRDLGLLVPEIPGALRLRGSVGLRGSDARVDLRAEGPAALALRIAGRVDTGTQLADLALTGQADAILASRLIAPVALRGPVQADLRLRGPLTLASLSGQLRPDRLRAVIPEPPLALQNLGGVIELGDGRAALDLRAQPQAGGALSVRGSARLTPPFEADLKLALDRAVFADGQLYQSEVTGEVALTGPLSGGGRIAGALRLGETTLRIATTGAGTIGTLPGLEHRGDPAAVRATRARAGLEDGADAPQPGLARPFALDLLIDAPRRIFVRGRGIDAELGGRVRVGGTTSAVLPSGGFELIRGRLDLLGKRFDLTEGSVTMEGRFAPRLRFVAAASTDSGPAQIELEGPADAPEIRFVAEGLPEEEVVARLLFGRDLTRLSPFQVAQMASALASLAGAGGEGLVGSLRRSAGLDDLDILTDETGATGLRVGKYLSQNAYADVALNPDGSSEVTLNLDLTETVTARGRLGDAGQTGLGLFFERDY